jgi:hypothetical protein
MFVGAHFRTGAECWIDRIVPPDPAGVQVQIRSLVRTRPSLSVNYLSRVQTDAHTNKHWTLLGVPATFGQINKH